MDGEHTAQRAWALPAAAGLLALENAGLLGALLFGRRAPAGVELALLVKFPLCVALVQRRAGAFLALMLWECFTLVVALLNPSISLAGRVAMLGAAGGGLTLLGLTLPLFPTARLGDG